MFGTALPTFLFLVYNNSGFNITTDLLFQRMRCMYIGSSGDLFAFRCEAFHGSVDMYLSELDLYSLSDGWITYDTLHTEISEIRAISFEAHARICTYASNQAIRPHVSTYVMKHSIGDSNSSVSSAQTYVSLHGDI